MSRLPPPSGSWQALAGDENRAAPDRGALKRRNSPERPWALAVRATMILPRPRRVVPDPARMR
jgi:hypothetical protein